MRKYQNQHYKDVAELLRGLGSAVHTYDTEKVGRLPQLVVKQAVRAFADLFTNDNINFNHEWFFEACGLVDSVETHTPSGLPVEVAEAEKRRLMGG